VSALYFDSCALIKLVVAETESPALEGWLRRHGGDSAIVTCDLAQTEVRRTLHRLDTDPTELAVVADFLNDVATVRLGPEVFIKAGDIAPGSVLRSLDAIHIAAALQLGPACRYFVTYDKRLATAATTLGLPVASPA
jgi:uncharacterized protein